MENVSLDEFAALGAVGIAVVALFSILILAVMAGSLKLCVSMMGSRNPSYLACVGTLLGIMFINGFLVAAAWSFFGQGAVVVVTPLTWFATLYLIGQLADCGYFRAFVIWIANSFVATVGVMVLIALMVVPMAMVGASMQDTMDQVAQQLDSASEDDEEFPIETFDDFPADVTNVKYGAYEEREGFEVPATQGNRFAEDPGPENADSATADLFFEPEPKPAPATPLPPGGKKVKRAADGTLLNPYFQ